MRGRPIRFLGFVLTGWLAVRTVWSWPEAERVEQVAERFVPHAVARLDPAAALARPDHRFLPLALERQLVPPAAWRPRDVGVGATARRRPPASANAMLSDAQILALFGLRHYVEVPVSHASESLAPSAAAPPPPPAFGPLPSVIPSRWRLSGWLMLRPGGGDARLVPLLGGSQAGARLSYGLGADRRVALFARAAAPLASRGAEVATGLEWRVQGAPVAAFVELRQREGAGLAGAAGVYGGGLKQLGGFRLEGYGQAGFVAGRAATPFAEAQVRTTRALGSGIDAGAGIWTAAQHGAARLDVGPTLALALPVRAGGTRLTLDWRHRIAGAAHPGSGIALSLGTDF